MLKIRLIPALLLSNGRCVKGTKFKDFRDVGHPVTAAKVYDAQGADELLFLDITASPEQRGILLDVIADTAAQCFMPLTVGGGVQTLDDIRILLKSGADKVSINTAAVQHPRILRDAADRFGSQCIVVSIDYRINTNGTREVVTHSGRQPTKLTPLDWAKHAVSEGAGEILLTSVDRDGTGQGYDAELVRQVADSVPVPVIAAGGVGTLQHLVEGVTQGHASAVAAGSIFHFTDQSVIKASAYMRHAGLSVRVG